MSTKFQGITFHDFHKLHSYRTVIYPGMQDNRPTNEAGQSGDHCTIYSMMEISSYALATADNISHSICKCTCAIKVQT